MLKRVLDEQTDENRGSGVELPPPPGILSEAVPVIEGSGRSIINITSGCAPGEDLTVAFGLELSGEPNTSQADVAAQFKYTAVRADLQWGIGDAQFKARCDVLMGTQLSITAENLRVQVRYLKATNPFSPALDPTFPTFRVNAAVGYNGVGRNSNPARFTELVQLQQEGSTVRVQIPQFAISYSAIPINDTLVTTRQIGFGTSYGVNYNLATAETNPLTNRQDNTESALPIANGSRYVEVTRVGVGAGFCFLVFGLSL